MQSSRKRLSHLSHIAVTVVSVASASASSVVLSDATPGYGTGTQTVNSSDSFLVSPDLQTLVASLPSSGCVVLSTAFDDTSLLPLSDVGVGAVVLGSSYSGSLSLAKAGAGTLTLSECNAYPAVSMVSAGTLSLSYGALGGSGFIGDATTSIGGVLAPGSSGSLGITLGSPTLIDWTLADPLPVLTGSNSQVNLLDLSASGYGWNLGTFNSGGLWDISTVGTAGSAAPSFIPEPGALMLGGLGLLALLRRRRE